MEVGLFINVLAQAGVPAISLSRGQIGLVAGIAALSIIVMLSARRRKGRDVPSPRSYAREQLARLREEGEMREDLEALLVRVQEVAREFNAQLDTRFCKLERVLRDADARIERLERLVRAADGGPACDVTLADEPAAEAIPFDRAVPARDGGRHAAIYRLAEAGRTPLEIAEATGQPRGEVELILALRQPSGRESCQSLSVCG